MVLAEELELDLGYCDKVYQGWSVADASESRNLHDFKNMFDVVQILVFHRM